MEGTLEKSSHTVFVQRLGNGFKDKDRVLLTALPCVCPVKPTVSSYEALPGRSTWQLLSLLPGSTMGF